MELEKYSTNQLLLRSDRITFGTIKPSRVERIDFLPDLSLTKLYLGLSSVVSTNKFSNVDTIFPGKSAFVFESSPRQPAFLRPTHYFLNQN